MAEYLIQDTTLTGIADAIREKEGSTDAILVASMAEKILGITTSLNVITEFITCEGVPFLELPNLIGASGLVVVHSGEVYSPSCVEYLVDIPNVISFSAGHRYKDAYRFPIVGVSYTIDYEQGCVESDTAFSGVYTVLYF